MEAADIATPASGLYLTSIVVQVMGGAIVVDLSPLLLGTEKCQVKKPHMTLLFRKRGFTQTQVREVQAFIDETIGAGAQVEFYLSRWGESSDLIHGELFDLAVQVREKFSHWEQDGGVRPPHVQLRTKARW